MRLIRTNNEVAVLRYRSLFLPSVFAAAAFLGLSRLIYIVSTGAFHKDGLATGIVALMFGVGAVVIYENSQFVFDLANRFLVWRKYWCFRTQSGIVPLNQIESVIVDPSPTKRSLNRLVIVCKGERISVSRSYDGSDLKELEALAGEIQSLIGLNVDVASNSLNDLINQGNNIEAISYVRSRLGISLTQAHEFVEAVKQSDGTSQE